MVDAMRGVIALVGDDVVVEFDDMLRAYGRAQTAPFAEELIYFDMSHIYPLVSSGRFLFLSADSCGLPCSLDAKFVRAKVSREFSLTSLRMAGRKNRLH